MIVYRIFASILSKLLIAILLITPFIANSGEKHGYPLIEHIGSTETPFNINKLTEVSLI